MPNHKKHAQICQKVLGKSYSEVDMALDWPVRFAGRGHRRYFHSVFESFVIGSLVTLDLKGGFAAVIHVLVDATDSILNNHRRRERYGRQKN